MIAYATLNIYMLSGCPAIVRIDHGTENGLLAAAQIGFRSSCTDEYAGRKSVRYGSSPANVVGVMIMLNLVHEFDPMITILLYTYV